MSGIAGLYHLDGRPVERAALVRMIDAAAHRAADGVGHWARGNVGLAHGLLATTAEDAGQSQPLLLEDEELCVTLDGRVDNRSELRADIRAAGLEPRGGTDAELVLQAYRRWGPQCASRIIGDFAFAIWDGRRRELFCARDFLGKRPFYYHFDGKRFLFGSEPQQILQDRTVPRRPNEGMIGEHLAVALRSNSETVFLELQRLPPAHSAVVGSSGLALRRYWSLNPDASLSYGDDREYVAHLREVLDRCVHERTRSNGPVAVELSGGLDSSSILAVVDAMDKGGGPSLDLRSVSMVFPGRPYDESSHITDVLSWVGRPGRFVRPEANGAALYEEEARRYLELGQFPNATMSYPVLSLARESGCRVLLTGHGGDEWLTGSNAKYADLIATGRPGTLIAELGRDHATVRRAARALWEGGVKPLIPHGLHHWLAGVRRRPIWAGWLREDFIRRIGLRERTRQAPWPQKIGYVAAERAWLLRTGWKAHASELSDRATSWFGVERRDPFDDRRFVELALALPNRQLLRGTQTKYVLRQAMTGLLPESVRQRADKAEFSEMVMRDLRAQGGRELFENLACAELGWVDEPLVLAGFDDADRKFAGGPATGRERVFHLWAVLAVERWLRACTL